MTEARFSLAEALELVGADDEAGLFDIDRSPANSHYFSVRLQILFGAFSRSHCGPTKSHYNC